MLEEKIEKRIRMIYKWKLIRISDIYNIKNTSFIPLQFSSVWIQFHMPKFLEASCTDEELIVYEMFSCYQLQESTHHQLSFKNLLFH